MIYLDSAATSLLKPPSVARATAMAVRTMASPGRGGHSAAMRAADTVFACREAAAELFHVPEPERVVFTMNATHALNIAIHSLVSPGDPVVISGYEHNSVTRPLHALGAQVRVAESPLFDPEAAVSAFRRALPGAKAAVCTMVSNVFGYLLPVREIAELCAAAGVPLIVDASQAAGCVAFDAAALGAAFVAMPGHKGLLGPQGTGILLCFAQPKPLLCGGTGSQSVLQDMPEELPDRLEAGTHNVPGIAGLLAGIRYLSAQGVEHIERRERWLAQRLTAQLRAQPRLEVFASPDPACQTAVLSVRCRDMDSELLAQKLAR
nr:aminotransferase class V-fold PLP-dependent enzyme [Oscillospiraceae bacterium]